MAQSLKPCQLCGREYLGEDARMCGPDCRQTETLFMENLGRAFSAPPGDDRRIFFYDASFGTLVDRWTVLLLQRLKTRDIELQKELDFHMHRIRRCLETKTVDRALAPNERELVLRISNRLLAINGRGWHLRSLAKNARADAASRANAALSFLELMDARAVEVRQLDLLMTGRTHAWKVY